MILPFISRTMAMKVGGSHLQMAVYTASPNTTTAQPRASSNGIAASCLRPCSKNVSGTGNAGSTKGTDTSSAFWIATRSPARCWSSGLVTQQTRLHGSMSPIWSRTLTTTPRKARNSRTSFGSTSALVNKDQVCSSHSTRRMSQPRMMLSSYTLHTRIGW